MNANVERMAGAKECITALAKLEYSAENLPQEADDAAIYAALQSEDAATLVAQFGPLTSRRATDVTTARGIHGFGRVHPLLYHHGNARPRAMVTVCCGNN